MKSSKLLVLTFGCLTSLATSAVELCPPGKNDFEDILNKFNELSGDDPFHKLYLKEKDAFKKATYIAGPTTSTPSSVKYEFPAIEVKPGEALYLNVPPNISERELLFMVLGHRQNPYTEKGWDPAKKWDSIPGLLSVQVNKCSPNHESSWRYWDGMSSGKFGAKFAEVRPEMEMEGLYEWYKNGHKSVVNDEESHKPLCVNGIRIVNVGEDVVELGSLQMKVTGPKASKYEEVNLSPSNRFGDYVTAEGRQYGSRDNSLVLGYGASGGAALPSGWKREGNSILIDPPVGKKLSSIEVTAGDERPDGTNGWAKLNAGVQKADGSVEWFINNENVPPMGVLIGSPLKEDYVLKAGDKIIIRSDSDDSYIAGVRWGIQ